MSQVVQLQLEMTAESFLTDETGKFLVDQNGDNLTAAGWQNVTADVMTNQAPNWTQGNSGNSVYDRVANVGTFTFVLNNSATNQAGLTGYYSPDHNNREVFFGLDAKVKLTVFDGVDDHQEWYGKIVSITPIPGMYGERKTQITCEDWMSFAATDNVRGITVQVNKRTDEILNTLIGLASETPRSTDFSTGDDIFTYALHDENSDTSSLMRVFQKLVMSDMGRIYLVNWGVLTYRPRSEALIATEPAAILTDSMLSMALSRKKANRVKKIQVSTFPVQLDTSPAVLWVSQRERSIDAGDTVTFDVPLRDPDGRATRVAASSLESAVADTDYKFSSSSGSGNDLNANLSLSYELKADVVTVTLTNSAGATGYLWTHQIRGTGLYLYEPVIFNADTGQSDGQILNVDMVYQDDPGVGEDIGGLLASWYAADQTDVESVTFCANINADLLAAAFLVPGDLVQINETQTGISRNYFINGTSKTMVAGDATDFLYVTWYLIQANQIASAWFLEVPGFSELESTTILGA